MEYQEHTFAGKRLISISLIPFLAYYLLGLIGFNFQALPQYSEIVIGTVLLACCILYLIGYWKGIKAKGNQLTTDTLNKIEPLESLPEPEVNTPLENDAEEDATSEAENSAAPDAIAVVDTPVEVTEVKPAGPVESVEPQKPVAPEPKQEKKSSYDADDKAPQITLDF